MNRSKPMKPGKGFKRQGAPRMQARDPDRVRSTPTVTDTLRAAMSRPNPLYELTKPRAKSEARRNPFLLTMARGQRCLLKVSGVCCGDPATTVAAHSNWSEHGKAGVRKADDCYHVWACFACHTWLDQGPAPAEEKRRCWDAAFEWMKEIWMDVVCGFQHATPKERAAAQWALDCVNKK